MIANLNARILSQLIRYGQVAEYVFVDGKGRINSKIIDSENGTPIYNQNNDLIGFIESYVFDGITYWYVYDDKNVHEYTNEGGKLKHVATHISLSGLREVKLDDMTVSNFSDSLQQRIDALLKRIRQMPDDNNEGTSWFMFVK